MSKQVIIGYSGHSYVVLDAAQKAGLQVEAYTEKKEATDNPYRLEYIGFESDDDFEDWGKGYEFILGIGDNGIRERVAELISANEEKLCSVVHPSAKIGANVKFGNGTFVAAGVLINPFVKIGMAAIINTGAIIEHECHICDFAHIAPGAVLAGNVKVGVRSFVGANAVIKEGVEIGNDVVIGAGTVVLDNVQSESKVVGNPGRLI